ncbi:MAG: cox cluster protein [Haloarcula sp.]
MSEPAKARSGQQIVLRLYVAIVVLAGIMGFVLGSIRPEDLEPELFGVIALPPTPFGVAIYGFVTIGIVLGVLLGLVVYVSERIDDAASS